MCITSNYAAVLGTAWWHKYRRCNTLRRLAAANAAGANLQLREQAMADQLLGLGTPAAW
jgi:hypothetical protein